ncbi:putative dipeptidase [Chitinivorax tropicus]|uniref:Putative dipeptidase n=1 Tax=Chitinivorax tropicus TaxID=714531 RepID=A0A840MRP2_9PROT|nr:dipeptidase [Chitinivorax tropicus]MBB5019749.1 putative dipeptidase [Chitinivorax tropicus]
MKYTGFVATTFSLALTLVFSQLTQAETLKKPALDQLIQVPLSEPPPELKVWLKQAAAEQPLAEQAVSQYLARSALSGDELINIGRLLGVYNRINNQEAVIHAIDKMVSIKTVRNEKIPPYEDPAMLEFGKLVESIAKDFGLAFRNVDNRVFEVRLQGKGKEEFGILTHADVVPVVADEWVLDDGTKLDPFKMARIGGRLYGRGTIDDKGSVAAVLYAMKVVKESGVPLERTIRLMIDTTEETGGDAIKYYREHATLPEYNIVLDSKYPAVVAEKGAGNLKVFFPVEAGAEDEVTIVAMSGAGSANTVPETATAVIKGGDLAQVASRLAAAREPFIKQISPKGGAFNIAFKALSEGIEVKVTGISAHGSRPEEGINPVPRLTMFLQASGVKFALNHYSRAVQYINDLYGLGYWGEQMGLAYQDDFMGPLTMSPNYLREKDGKLEVTTNIRMPRGRTPDVLSKAVAGKVNAWAESNRVNLEISHSQGNWMARDPKGPWLVTLLNIFGEVTGLDAKSVSTAGSTTAKQMPNAINFGPAMPGKKYTAHNAKEYKEIADLGSDLQMFTEMLVRIGNLDKMQ